MNSELELQRFGLNLTMLSFQGGGGLAMQLATLEQQKVAMLAIIRQLEQQGINLESVAEGAKLQILGSVELCTYPAHYRVNCASAVDGLILEALEPPAVDI